MTEFKKVGMLALILVILVVAWTYYSSNQIKITTSNDVKNYILDSLSSSPDFANQNTYFQVYSITKLNNSNPNGQWTAQAKITLNPHSQCPTVFIRYYWLLPLHYDQKYVTGSCQTTNVVVFPEQAIVDSKQFPSVVPIANSDAYACGFMLPLTDSADISNYCPQVPIDQLTSFANSLPNQASWIVYWQEQNSTAFVAMDNSGNQILPK